MYLIVLETINQGTREHRCGYGHHEIKIKKKNRNEFSESLRQLCIYFFLTEPVNYNSFNISSINFIFRVV